MESMMSPMVSCSVEVIIVLISGCIVSGGPGGHCGAERDGGGRTQISHISLFSPSLSKPTTSPPSLHCHHHLPPPALHPPPHRSSLAAPARAPTLAAPSHSSPRSAAHHHHPSRHHHHHPSPSPPTIGLTDSHRQKSTIDGARHQSPQPDAATSLRRHR
ncbi:hypothetical protein RND81_07G046800 [Saponaria officinalis]|uniref:Uncharacterized protein n=1 Tax=Saponaria officinalis TaxID=3572 RepID=A0AAW1JNT9_SAPOF